MSSVAFRKIQAGQELVAGTGVAADEKLLGTLSLTPQPTFHQPVEDRGSLAEFRRSATIAQMAQLTWEGSATYQQFLHLLAMSLKGGVEPTSATATGAKYDNNSVFSDLTNALDDNTGTHETIAGFVAAEDKIYVRAAAAFRGVKFTLEDTVNALASSISTVEVSDGASGWITATLVKDRTKSGTASMARTGIVEFVPPAAWASDTVDGDAGFWVRFIWSADWTASVEITEIDTVPQSAVWTFTPNLTSGNSQNSYTIEYGDDTQAWESNFVLCTSWELRAALNAVAEFRSQLFGNFPSKVSFTSGLPDLGVYRDIVANDLEVWIDGTWANLGTTLKSTLVTGATIRLPASGLSPIKTATGSHAYTVTRENRRHLEIELELLMGTDAITEYDAFAAETDRAIRLKFTGPIIEGANAHELTIDCFGRYMSQPQLLGSREGGNIFSLVLHSFEDDNGNEFSIAAQTAKATL